MQEVATIGRCCFAGQGLSSRSFPGTSQTFSRMLELRQGRGKQWPACRRRGAICVEPEKTEDRLIFLCRDLTTRGGGLGGKLAFLATRPFLKMKACCGEEDLPDQMGQQHLCQQVGQPVEERERENLGSKDTVYEDEKWHLTRDSSETI